MQIVKIQINLHISAFWSRLCLFAWRKLQQIYPSSGTHTCAVDCTEKCVRLHSHPGWFWLLVLHILYINPWIASSAGGILFLLERENKACHFMWTVCLADDSLDISSLIFFENKKYFRMLSATTMITVNIRTDRPEQTVYTQMRRRRMWRFIRVYTICHSSSHFKTQHQVLNCSCSNFRTSMVRSWVVQILTVFKKILDDASLKGYGLFDVSHLFPFI